MPEKDAGTNTPAWVISGGLGIIVLLIGSAWVDLRGRLERSETREYERTARYEREMGLLQGKVDFIKDRLDKVLP